jgi:hypothetical protein
LAPLAAGDTALVPDCCPCAEISAASVLGENGEEVMPEAGAVVPADADELLLPVRPKDANNAIGESAELDEPEVPLPAPSSDCRQFSGFVDTLSKGTDMI